MPDEGDQGVASRWRARVRTALGWATGDRRVEAEGRVETREAERGEPRRLEESVVEQETEEVRREHGDLS